MVEAVKGGGEELQILPPFYIYRAADGRQYTSEMMAFFLEGQGLLQEIKRRGRCVY